jgi:hypothetical protein
MTYEERCKEIAGILQADMANGQVSPEAFRWLYDHQAKINYSLAQEVKHVRDMIGQAINSLHKIQDIGNNDRPGSQRLEEIMNIAELTISSLEESWDTFRSKQGDA